MNWLFRRHFWVVHLVFLAILAAIFAKTFDTLAGFFMSKSMIVERPEPRAFRKQMALKIEKDYKIANERNLFAARREAISLEDIENEFAEPGRWQDALPSNLPLKLISTMVFMDPFDSRAIILNTSSGRSQVYSIGECENYQKKHKPEIETILSEESWEPERHCNNIDGIATVKRIEEFRVYVFNERDRRYEFLSLHGEDKRPRKLSLPKMFEIEEGEGIRKIGANSYEIEQGEFDKAMSNMAKLMTEARAVPETDSSGNVIGFRVVYIKPGSLFEKIGILQNDILSRINGYELGGVEKALELFSKLRSSEKFNIDVKRGDRSVTMDYSVTP